MNIGSLVNAIRKHRDARGHDRCKENDIELYRAINEPVPFDVGLPCSLEFMNGCSDYHKTQGGSGFTARDLLLKFLETIGYEKVERLPKQFEYRIRGDEIEVGSNKFQTTEYYFNDDGSLGLLENW